MSHPAFIISNQKIMNDHLVSYYKERANEYDKVYLNPPEQGDLRKATDFFQTLFAQKTVLELACGTGYWTERIGETATAVHAIDINDRVLRIAEERRSRDNISYSIADMYTIESNKKYDGLFGGFIWSHILLQDLDNCIERWKGLLKPGGVIAFIDSVPVRGTHHDSGRIASTDEYGNTYQTRILENGSEYAVLKNFPTKEFIQQKLSAIADAISFIQLEYYWIVSGKLKATGA